MRRRRGTVVLLALSATMLMAGCNDCEDDTRFLEAYRAAILYPETFQTYRQEHQGEFDDRFFSCADDCSWRLDKFIVSEEDKCFEIFIDPDDVNDCLDDLDPWGDIYINSVALRTILKNGTPYNLTVLYADVSAQKASNPSGYVNLIGAMTNVAAPYLTCRRCRRTIFGL